MPLGLDTSALISSFATAGKYVVTRRPAAMYTNGVASFGLPQQLDIVAAVVPASGRDLERLPEGRRSVETRVVFTATPLLVGDEGARNEADRIAIGGDAWEVQHVESWPSFEGYYRAIVQRAGNVQP